MDRFEYFFLWLRNSMGIPNPILYFTSNDSLNHKSPISMFMDEFQHCFSFNWKIIRDSKLDIEVYLKWLSEPQSPISCLWTNFNQIFYFQLEIHWGFQIQYRSLLQISVWTTKAQFPFLWPHFNLIYLLSTGKFLHEIIVLSS